MKKLGPSYVFPGMLIVIAIHVLIWRESTKQLRVASEQDWRQTMAWELFEGRARLTGTVWITNVGPDRVNVTFEFGRAK